MTRRDFLASTAGFAAAAMLSSCRAPGTTLAAPKFSAYPFALGVASGDPAADSVILWTRLAPHPLQPGGGMGPEPVAVTWRVAEDEAMTRIVRRGTAVANSEWAHSVHVDAGGLRPDHWYWYQFEAGGHLSAKGRTRTMPAASKLPERLRFAFASCQHYETGLYTAYEHMAREDLDLIIHLGDYIYEGGGVAGRTRLHADNKARLATLEDYRARYGLYKLDPLLQAAHAMAPWIVTWDDHEVRNDYAGAIPTQPDENFLQVRAAGYQAYYENMPLRVTPRLASPDLRIYRRLEFGRLASFHVLDTRQYRSDQLGTGRLKPTPAFLDETRTLLGSPQRQWLYDGLDRSTAGWNVLTQQVMMARVDLTPGPEVGVSGDMWAGYEYERRRVLQHLDEHRTKNPVVLTGDYHTNYANDLVVDFDRPESRRVGVEFVGTSISSNGNGQIDPPDKINVMSENPFVKFRNHERGYVSCEVTPQQWISHYRTISYVDRPGAPLNTRATFLVENDRPALQAV